MNIRPETNNDRARIATLISRTYLAEGANVIRLTSSLRDLDTYNPNFGLIGEDNEKVEAFILFTEIKAGDGKALFLAPLAFNPKNVNLDIIDFVESTIHKVADDNYRYIFMLGDVKTSGCKDCQVAESLGFATKPEPKGSTLLVKDLGEGGKLSGEVVIPDILK